MLVFKVRAPSAFKFLIFACSSCFDHSGISGFPYTPYVVTHKYPIITFLQQHKHFLTILWLVESPVEKPGEMCLAVMH